MKLRDFLSTIRSNECIVVCCQTGDEIDSIKERFIINDPRKTKLPDDPYICCDIGESKGREEADWHVEMICVSTFNETDEVGKLIAHPCFCVLLLHPCEDEFSQFDIDSNFVEFKQTNDMDSAYIQIRKDAVDSIVENGNNSVVTMRNGNKYSLDVCYERCCEVLV